MKIILFGKDGQLGRALARSLSGEYDLITFNRSEADITNRNLIQKIILTNKPDIIINCAAYTKVDEAENDTDTARSINGFSLANIGNPAKEINSLVIHFSTDYVFDGRDTTPYTENDETNPLNEYGRSKLLGEKVLLNSNPKSLIFRVSWLHSKYGNNFISKIVELSQTNRELKIVNDQIGSPITTSTISSVIKHIISFWATVEDDKFKEYGVYNLAPSGSVTWYELVIFFKQMISNGILSLPSIDKTHFIPVMSTEFITKAERPKFSLLNTSKLTNNFLVDLPSWEQGIIDEYGN